MSLPINLPKAGYIQGFWKLDETSSTRYDETSNDNDLTDNATVLYGTGEIGNAADFELDTSEYLSITDASQTGLDITGEITISTWIKVEVKASVAGTSYAMISKYASIDNKRCYLVYLSFTDDKIKFILSSEGATTTTATSTSTINSTTAWFHIAVTLNQTTDLMQIYINGSADGSAVAYATDIADKTSPFLIGSYSDAYFFDGLIDEVIVWNTCLTATEVLQVKNVTAYCYGRGVGMGSPAMF